MLGFSPLGTRALGAPSFIFANSITVLAILPGLQSIGILFRSLSINGLGVLPSLSVMASVTHPYAWTPQGPNAETWTPVDDDNTIWTPVPKSPEVWS